MVVNGLCSAIGWSQLGIVATGTNAEETNVTGNRIVKPYAFDASGEEDERPMKANTQEKAHVAADRGTDWSPHRDRRPNRRRCALHLRGPRGPHERRRHWFSDRLALRAS